MAKKKFYIEPEYIEHLIEDQDNTIQSISKIKDMNKIILIQNLKLIEKLKELDLKIKEEYDQPFRTHICIKKFQQEKELLIQQFKTFIDTQLKSIEENEKANQYNSLSELKNSNISAEHKAKQPDLKTKSAAHKKPQSPPTRSNNPKQTRSGQPQAKLTATVTSGQLSTTNESTRPQAVPVSSANIPQPLQTNIPYQIEVYHEIPSISGSQLETKPSTFFQEIIRPSVKNVEEAFTKAKINFRRVLPKPLDKSLIMYVDEKQKIAMKETIIEANKDIVKLTEETKILKNIEPTLIEKVEGEDNLIKRNYGGCANISYNTADKKLSIEIIEKYTGVVKIDNDIIFYKNGKVEDMIVSKYVEHPYIQDIITDFIENKKIRGSNIYTRYGDPKIEEDIKNFKPEPSKNEFSRAG